MEHSQCSLDIFQTISHYYQVVCTTHNMVIGASFSKRGDAEAKMSELYNEMWGMPGEEKKVVHVMGDGGKGLMSDSPGVASHSDTKKVT